MRWSPLLLCGWPGLARLWFQGHIPSLIVAIGFSILLNLALVSSFLWPWSLGETFPMVAWPMILIVWIASAMVSYSSLTDLMAGPKPSVRTTEPSTDTLFNEAQTEYLRGHWTEAETLLLRRLEQVPRDVEARLLLATLLRHTRRMDDARNQLKSIQRFDQSIFWENEIQREQQLIDLIEKEAELDTFDDDNLKRNLITN